MTSASFFFHFSAFATALTLGRGCPVAWDLLPSLCPLVAHFSHLFVRARGRVSFRWTGPTAPPCTNHSMQARTSISVPHISALGLLCCHLAALLHRSCCCFRRAYGSVCRAAHKLHSTNALLSTIFFSRGRLRRSQVLRSHRSSNAAIAKSFVNTSQKRPCWYR